MMMVTSSQSPSAIFTSCCGTQLYGYSDCLEVNKEYYQNCWFIRKKMQFYQEKVNHCWCRSPKRPEAVPTRRVTLHFLAALYREFKLCCIMHTVFHGTCQVYLSNILYSQWVVFDLPNRVRSILWIWPCWVDQIRPTVNIKCLTDTLDTSHGRLCA